MVTLTTGWYCGLCALMFALGVGVGASTALLVAHERERRIDEKLQKLRGKE